MTTKLILASLGLLALSAIPTKAVARDHCYRPSYGRYYSAPVYRTSYVNHGYRGRHYSSHRHCAPRYVRYYDPRCDSRHRHRGISISFGGLFR